MRVWHFTETAYPYLPPEEDFESIRITLPNRYFDPVKGAELYNRYLDEWLIAEDEGLDIIVNEHHQTATCIDPAAPLILSALARQSTKARLLILGNPLANRKNPVRVAEEMAMIDVLSHGRLEVGFVRGVPYEVLPANSNPARMNERMWEAIDLINEAFTRHDGPFSFEGDFFHFRNVNIWPRPYQQPTPPIWVSSTSPGGARKIGTYGYRLATFLTGFDGTRKVYDSYREGWRSAGLGDDIPTDRLSYSGMVYTADTEEEAYAGAEKLLWYVTSNKVPAHLANPPGYVPTAANLQIMRGAEHPLKAFQQQPSVEKAIEKGIMFAGTPDQVYNQIKRMYDYVGGFGNFLMMGQAGFLEHDETVAGIQKFAREVYPRLQADFPGTRISGY
ncbi:Flavin-dependent oxidoreductase, luciferase family (includes alkanesulfonate monooxygenase SsuD and methylene tetrahydromethanopterin reductase) [Lutimaribacter pacificus]|uniref:Flavin-dependent oxidoreductase, luciferase family (Includes alkanesulfonate monooxygenase SsuD and methylene tetrahydromethanopterin reductase) n=1 Tax=Lutimaribacter pacificus TaxID=391948 RepID=A0A1H0M2K7_9RHOB|nr:Flavin-dependent oxidoreductase, luciferase family (includes alkanesulfonate monooxygenase SsuD and methylene tetrahydromethanopterin reductase) [Lutimaribacter pacificus]SHK77108.1 Flavin-dependent oxidoreductase, luciferase family (includes alkanesulfonate monooxygenase SsuD and methylene tetrahydromethanopterin reductase) [Lutimaribacter pacificus]